MEDKMLGVGGVMSWNFSSVGSVILVVQKEEFRQCREQNTGTMRLIHKGCPAAKNSNPRTTENTRRYTSNGRLNPECSTRQVLI